MKKKLGDMTDEEIEQLKTRYCKHDALCKDCPFRVNDICLSGFPFWKCLCETYKDKEFEVEVEE